MSGGCRVLLSERLHEGHQAFLGALLLDNGKITWVNFISKHEKEINYEFSKRYEKAI